MVFVGSAAFGQTNLPVKPSLFLLQQGVKPVLQQSFTRSLLKADSAGNKPFLSANFYATQLGFFCKQEIKFDKATKIPFRFRLGSVEDCDRLEGKRKVF